MMKERRKLVLVVRETPLSAMHLENMVAVTRAGAVVLPASPSFYSKPATLDALLDTVVGRVLDQLGLPNKLAPRWGDEEVEQVNRARLAVESHRAPTSRRRPSPTLDLFALGRQASAARDARLGRPRLVRARAAAAGRRRLARTARRRRQPTSRRRTSRRWAASTAARAAGADLLVAGQRRPRAGRGGRRAARVAGACRSPRGENDGERLVAAGGARPRGAAVGRDAGAGGRALRPGHAPLLRAVPAGAPRGAAPGRRRRARWGRGWRRWRSASAPTSCWRRSSPSARCAWATTPTTRR